MKRQGDDIMTKETVTISKSEYESLLNTEAHMNALEARGVDNWIGYVSYCQYCTECDTDEIPWTEEKCPECGEVIETDF